MTTERMAIDPAVMMGKPVIRGTRITVELVLRKPVEGATKTDVLEDYPHLTAEDVRAAAAYGAASVAHEELEQAVQEKRVLIIEDLDFGRSVDAHEHTP